VGAGAKGGIHTIEKKRFHAHKKKMNRLRSSTGKKGVTSFGAGWTKTRGGIPCLIRGGFSEGKKAKIDRILTERGGGKNARHIYTSGGKICSGARGGRKELGLKKNK